MHFCCFCLVYTETLPGALTDPWCGPAVGPQAHDLN